jgi:hypothetical protein
MTITFRLWGMVAMTKVEREHGQVPQEQRDAPAEARKTWHAPMVTRLDGRSALNVPAASGSDGATPFTS